MLLAGMLAVSGTAFAADTGPNDAKSNGDGTSDAASVNAISNLNAKIAAPGDMLWTQATAAAAWPARGYHTSVVHDVCCARFPGHRFA